MLDSSGLRFGLRHTRGAVVMALLVAAVLATMVTVRARAADVSESQACRRHAADAAARSQVVTGSGPSITVIGDSWSVGRGLERLSDGWPRELPGRVRVAGFSGSGFSRHASRCGNRAFETRAAAARGADLVVVQGGLNDMDESNADIRAGFESLMSSLAGRRVVVIGPASAPSRAALVQRVDTTLAELCDEYDVAYIDTNEWELAYLPDGLHLTPAGHVAFGQRVAGELVARGLVA